MYSLSDYLGMAADRTRRNAFMAGLEATIKPGFSFVDLGAGPALFSLVAARLGADPIYAIEPDASLKTGEELARANGLESRIHFIRDLSTNVTLPERANVIMADLAGAVPLLRTAIPSLIDARERLLAEGGTLMPTQDTLYLALVETDRHYPFDVEALSELGFDLSRGLRCALNAPGRKHVAPEEVLTTSAPWATLAYSNIDSPHASGEGRVTVERAGRANAVCMWFEREVTPGIRFSTGPGEPRTVYSQALLPLEHPLLVEAGEAIDISIMARLVGDDEYIWQWQIRTSDRSKNVETDQTSLHAQPLSLSDLASRERSFVPSLGIEGKIDIFALERMTGEATLEEIAREVLERYPGEVKASKEALDRVAALSARYSR
jgi:hypothetical protein